MQRFIDRAFNRWSSRGVREPRVEAAGVPAAGLTFDVARPALLFGQSSDTAITNTTFELLKVAALQGDTKIVVAFTDSFRMLNAQCGPVVPGQDLCNPDLIDAETYELDFGEASRTNNIRKVVILINNARFSGADSERKLFSILIHEVGHALGLDHTAIGSLRIFPEEGAKSHLFLPMMLQTQASRVELHPDDKSSLSSLYERPDVVNVFRSTYGYVTGKIQYPAGFPQSQVIAVYAIRIPANDRSREWQERAFVHNPGQYEQIFETLAPSGSFRIAVPEGRYELRAETLAITFYQQPRAQQRGRPLFGRGAVVVTVSKQSNGLLVSDQANVEIPVQPQ